MTSFTCIHTNGVYQQYKGNICNRAFKCGSELPEYVALILRNGGSQSPDRWLRELRNNQQIEIKLDESCKEPKIIIHTDKMTEEVSQIVKLLSEEKPEVFAAIHENGEIILLEQTEIIRIYAENDRVYAKTKDGSYRLKARLYELEERLNKKMFIRISNSEIINLKEVKKFDLSFSGTICVSMSDKTATYVSRRYVRKIKQVLGL